MSSFWDDKNADVSVDDVPIEDADADGDDSKSDEDGAADADAAASKEGVQAGLVRNAGQRRLLKAQQAAAPAGSKAAPLGSAQTTEGALPPHAFFSAEGEEMQTKENTDGSVDFDPELHVFTHEARLTLTSNQGLTAAELHKQPKIVQGASVQSFGKALFRVPAKFAEKWLQATEINQLELKYTDPDGKYNTALDTTRVAGMYVLSYNAKHLSFPVGVSLVQLSDDGTKIEHILSALNPRPLPNGARAFDVMTPGVVQTYNRRLADHTSRTKKIMISDALKMANPDLKWEDTQPYASNAKLVWLNSKSNLLAQPDQDYGLVTVKNAKGEPLSQHTTTTTGEEVTYYVVDKQQHEVAFDNMLKYRNSLNIVNANNLAFIASRADFFSVEAQRAYPVSKGANPNSDPKFGAVCGQKSADDCVYYAIEILIAVQFPYTDAYVAELCVPKVHKEPQVTNEGD